MAETKKTLAEIREDANTAVNILNGVILNTDKTEITLAEAEAKVAETLDAYTQRSKELTFESLAGAPKPMLAAIKKLNYDVLVKKSEKNGATGVVTYSITDGTQQIKLTEFDKTTKSAADSNWTNIATAFCLQATYKTCLDLGEKMAAVRKKLESTYLISDVARKIEMGQTPNSKTQMTKNLQSVLDAVVGTDVAKVTTKDLEYVYTLMNRRGGCGVISTPTLKSVEILLMDILHTIITNKTYVVNYQQKKVSTVADNPVEVETLTDDLTAA